ncbi:MAG: TetR/AcrR family transcriptional regulator [Polyangiaceae bacterium]
MRKKKAKPRRRLDAEAARKLILDATERRLVRVGPSGIRLQEVAKDAGVSHPTVLHHFGSRELLVKAVIERSVRAINASLVEAITASRGDERQLEALLENVAAVLERSGHARIVMWLALEGHRIEAAEAHLTDVVDAVHALRMAETECAPRPKREDTARTVVLAALALFGGALLAPALLDNAGLGDGAREAPKFRAWLARVLLEHLEG